ncbi:MAG: TlpA family protein disulfide reductase [Planctomycetales bacterium]|nr:TlpA family protein disulfide reductase [Planctomycetales bacterium]
MLNTITRQRRGVYLGLVLVLMSAGTAVSYGGGQRGERPGGAGMAAGGVQDEKQAQLRREAQTAMTQISQTLTTIMEQTRQNQRPTQSLIENAETILGQSKQYAPVLDDKQKADFMLLQAWKGFYQKNPVEAVNWSMRACKTYDAGQDGWISQALFCLLNDKRPLKPQAEKPRQAPRRPVNPRPRRGGEAAVAEAVKPQPFSEKGVLEFDLMGLREELLRDPFSRLECVTAGGDKVEYKPGQDTLCILFWQDEAAGADANDVPVAPMPQTDAAIMPGTVEMGTAGAYDTQKTTLEAQRDYVGLLMEACEKTPTVKFMQVNTVNPKDLPAFLDALPDYSEQRVPVVVAAHPAANARRFAGLNAATPFMLIVDTAGKVKYAGTAGDFMPAFILTELTGVPIPLEKKTDQETMPGQMMMPGLFEPMPTDPNKPTPDSSEPNSGPGTSDKVHPFANQVIPGFPLPSPKPAAMLRSLTWIKGQPVKFQPGQVYVVEFWATWCPPCKTSIPHLTKIQEKFKDKGVTVIGITNETAIGDVKKFVAEQGGNMNYTVAIDSEQQVAAAYMGAYGQNGIPTAFVVDKAGLVVWHGHPGEYLEEVLRRVTDQPHDAAIAVQSPGGPEPEKPSSVVSQASDFPTQALEDQLRAENLLRSAQMHIEESRKLTMKNPQQGIEDARTVLTEFPGTPYAEQARELLRRVPERWKKRHNITDAELGF